MNKKDKNNNSFIIRKMQTAAGGPLRIKFTPEQIVLFESRATRVPGMNNSGGNKYRKEGVLALQHLELESKRKEEEIKSRMEMRPILKRKVTTAEKLRGKKDEYKQVPLVVGMSGADPVGEFVLAGVGLNGIGALAKTGLWNVAKYTPTTQLGNWGRLYFVGNAFKNSFNGTVPTLTSLLASKNLVKTESNKQKRVISEGTYPMYKGKLHSVKEVVNPDGTVNPRQAMRILHEVSELFPGSYKMEHRLENPEWHQNDPTTYHHTKNVALSAWGLDVPYGFTKYDLMVAALGHDFGKIVAGDGHAQIGADLAKQVFPDLTEAQYKAIAEHMGTPKTSLGKATKAADIDNGRSVGLKLLIEKQGGKMNILEFLKNGNKIHIKEKNKGSFTRWCGGNVTEECILRGKNSSNPKIRKKATFADNARHFKHRSGGLIVQVIKALEGSKLGQAIFNIGSSILQTSALNKKIDLQANIDKTNNKLNLEALILLSIKLNQDNIRNQYLLWVQDYLSGKTLDLPSLIVSQHLGYKLLSLDLAENELKLKNQNAYIDAQARLLKSENTGNLISGILEQGMGLIGNYYSKNKKQQLSTISNFWTNPSLSGGTNNNFSFNTPTLTPPKTNYSFLT